jgi:hypothetical protein
MLYTVVIKRRLFCKLADFHVTYFLLVVKIRSRKLLFFFNVPSIALGV